MWYFYSNKHRKVTKNVGVRGEWSPQAKNVTLGGGLVPQQTDMS